MGTVPSWVAIAGAVAGFLVAVSTLITVFRGSILRIVREAIRSELERENGALQRILALEQKIDNGLTVTARRNAEHLGELRVSLARTEQRIEDWLRQTPPPQARRIDP